MTDKKPKPSAQDAGGPAAGAADVGAGVPPVAPDRTPQKGSEPARGASSATSAKADGRTAGASAKKTSSQPAAPRAEPKPPGAPAGDTKSKSSGSDAGTPKGTATPAASAANASAASAAGSANAPAAGGKSGATRSGSGQPPRPGSTSTPPPGGRAPRGQGLVIGVLVVILILVAAVAAWLWNQTQQAHDRLASAEARIETSTAQSRQALERADRAMGTIGTHNRKLDDVSAQLRESRAELDSLSDAFQMLTDRSSDLVLINDIDHLITIAQQQLQLSGNVANAIISLETAQAQLARANRPALASLQQTINGDLERLRAASTIDIAALSARLDELAGLVAQAPLLVPDKQAPDSSDASASQPDGSHRATRSRPAASADAPWWRTAWDRTWQWTVGAWDTVRGDLGQFVSIRRVDDSTALLLSPDQASRFRDNLRLRILTTRLALMMGQAEIWDTETQALAQAIQGRFDAQSALSRKALSIARDMADTSIERSLPTVANSMKALEAVREAAARGQATPSEQPDEAASRASDNGTASAQDTSSVKPDQAQPGTSGNAVTPHDPTNDARAAQEPDASADGEAAADVGADTDTDADAGADTGNGADASDNGGGDADADTDAAADGAGDSEGDADADAQRGAAPQSGA